MSHTIDSITMLPPGSDAPRAAGTSTLANPQPWFVSAVTGTPLGEGGPVVNEHTALNYATVYACVSLIAAKIAAVPLRVYKRVRGGMEPATDRSEHRLLYREFNPDMSSMTGREAGIAHLLTWGNSYTQIVRNKSESRVLELRPLGPDVVEPRRAERNRLVYDVYERGSGRLLATLEAREVLHVPGMGFDGVCGYSPVRVAKSSIRAGLAQDREAERFVTRGIRPPGAIKFPAGRKFKDQQAAAQYRDQIRQLHSHEDGSLSILILEDGADWMSLGVEPEAAQMLESRKYSRNEICGLYRVPPHLVGGVETSTSWGTGIAEQNQAFVDNCLMLWMERIEQELWRKLAGGDEDITYRHCVEQLLRGDFPKRAAALEILHRRGIVSDNEWREIDTFNAVPGGDVRHFPLNEGRIDMDGNPVAAPAPAPSPSPGRPAAPAGEPDGDEAPAPTPTSALVPILGAGLVDAAARCLRKEAAEAVRAAGKPGAFVGWIDEFYGRHAAMVADSCRHYAEGLQLVAGRGADYPARHVARSRAELLTAAEVPAADLAASVDRCVRRWTAARLAEVAAEFVPATPTGA